MLDICQGVNLGSMLCLNTATTRETPLKAGYRDFDIHDQRTVGTAIFVKTLTRVALTNRLAIGGVIPLNKNYKTKIKLTRQNACILH